jgi:photosystem II stability/assembly factor-like uncharacterized protein
MFSHQITRDMTSPWVRSLSVVGSDYAWLSTKSGQIFRTTNGGVTWDSVPLQAGNKAEMVYFFNHQLGWMVNRKREVWQTSDGGNAWTLLASLTKGGEDDYIIPLNDIWFIDSSHGWIIDSTSVWRTEDAGRSWERYYPTNNSQGVNELIYCGRFATTKNGWLGGDHGVIFITSDGGRTWLAKELASADISFSDTGIVDSSYGWLVATDGTLYSSKDQGKTWTAQSNALNDDSHVVLSASFISKTDGWAVGRTPSSRLPDRDAPSGQQPGLAFRTVNGGESWRAITIEKPETIYWRVCFINKDQGWITGTNQLYRTNDGGNTWSVSLHNATSSDK